MKGLIPYVLSGVAIFRITRKPLAEGLRGSWPIKKAGTYQWVCVLLVVSALFVEDASGSQEPNLGGDRGLRPHGKGI